MATTKTGKPGDGAEQKHHYFASTAFNWAAAPTRREAIEKVAGAAGATTIKEQVQRLGGLYVWSCRVDVPQSQPYTIEGYAPRHLIDGDKETGVRVPTSDAQEHRIVDRRGFVVVED